MAFPTRWLIVSLTACSLAGCGQAKRAEPPHLPRPLAAQLALAREGITMGAPEAEPVGAPV